MTLPYVGPRGPSDAKIMWIGEIPGKAEVASGRTHSGPSSQEDERMMVEAGLHPHSISYTNVFRSYPPNGNVDEWITFRPTVAAKRGFIPRGNAFIHPDVVSHLDDLEREIAAVRPNLMILAGNVALWAVLGEWGISHWRGSLLLDPRFGIKCLLTFNPAYLFMSHGKETGILVNWKYRPIIIWDYKKVAREWQTKQLPEIESTFNLRPRSKDTLLYLDCILSDCRKGPTWFAADIETKFNQIDCIGIARSPSNAMCIPFFSAEQPIGHYSEEEEALIILVLARLFSHPNARLIGHNWSYDASYIAKIWGILAPCALDTMIAWHTLFTGLEKSLAFVSSIILPNHRYWKDEGKTWSVSAVEERWAYCCKDVCATFAIKEALDKLTSAMGLSAQVEEEMANFPVFLDTGFRGIRQDSKKRKTVSKDLQTHSKQRSEILEYIFDHPVNVNSSKQMKELFFGDLGLPVIINRKTENPTLAADALERIAEREPILRHPIMLIEQIRSLGVYDSTFARAKLDPDGRLRTSFNIAGTDTLRLSSSKTPFGTGADLQNIPKGSQIAIAKLLEAEGELAVDEIASALNMSLEKAENEVDALLDKSVLARTGRAENGLDVVKALFILPNIRALFLADEGMGWLEADLERADVQVVVWEADDEDLKAILRSGVDLHQANVEAMDLKGDATHSARDLAKKGIHAIDYGVRARTLASHLKITVHAAEAFINRWFSIHPKILEWHRRVEARLKERRLEHRYVESAFGFRRYYFDRPEQAFTKALAWVPQHTVAITINRGIRNLYYSNLPLDLLLQVHDSCSAQVLNSLPVLETRIDPLDGKSKTYETSGLFHRIRQHLLIPIPYSDPLTIPISLSYSPTDWGTVQPIIPEEGSAEAR